MLKRIVISLSVLASSFAHAAIDVPKEMPQALVADYAQMLTEAERAALSAKLRNHFVEKTNVIVVVTIPSLEAVGEASLQDWNMRLADTWKPGNAQKSNGVIVTINGTKAPFKVRITPGRGLEGPLTDVFLKRLIEDSMKPVLNQPGRYFDGVNVAVDGMVKQIGDEFAPRSKKEPRHTGFTFGLLLICGFSLMVILLVAVALLRKSREEPVRLRYVPPPPRRDPPRTTSTTHATTRREIAPPPRRLPKKRDIDEWNIPSTPANFDSGPSYSSGSDSSSSSSISIDTGGSFSGGGAGD